MNLDLFSPKIETEDLLLSTTKNCETLFEQTHREPQETLDFKFYQQREIFWYKPSIDFGPITKWMLGLTSLNVYNSIFHITEENNKC